mgnify:CR=1 FL=1
MAYTGPKYVVVTGGVMSGVGKGLTTASMGKILGEFGYRTTAVKIDPYINYDAGTLRPTEHGEVWVTDDGGEIDQDLGNYERFLGLDLPRCNNLTTGQIYHTVIERERAGEDLGQTVQPIPHITDEIKRRVVEGAAGADVALIEVGGTVGDIESLPFLEACRQLKVEVGSQRALFMHLTLVPFISAAGELKTKPTQHSVRELASLGIKPDVLLCRAEHPIPDGERQKIANFCNVRKEAVIPALDAPSIYSVPLQYHGEGLDTEVLRGFGITDAPEPDLSRWYDVVDRHSNPEGEVTIGVVGKYVGLQDAYKSLNEALIHGGMAHRVKVNIKWIDAEVFEQNDSDIAAQLEPMHGILVPGGFGERGSEGKIASVRFARERKVPFFGICLGMQMACVEGARNAGIDKASSTEFGTTEEPVVGIITEWMTEEGLQTREAGGDLGGTMRLGAYDAKLAANSHVSSIYGGETDISERHRHRYEVNGKYIEPLEKQGLIFSGMSPDGLLPEIVERPDHPWFVGVQFHPELKSKPFDPHPLFAGFIGAALEQARLV